MHPASDVAANTNTALRAKLPDAAFRTMTNPIRHPQFNRSKDTMQNVKTRLTTLATDRRLAQWVGDGDRTRTKFGPPSNGAGVRTRTGMTGTTLPAPSVADRADPGDGSFKLAVMIITRDRPMELERCLTSLARMTRPVGVELTWIVVDNATPSQEAQIRELGRAVGLPLTTANEPVRGYSSPRNRALEMALAAGCDLMWFIDDDVAAEPDVLVRHVEALRSGAIDVSMGGQTGRDIGRARLLRRMKVATYNVAFRRRLVDRSNGFGIRFDTRLNLTGFEDHEFFYEAQAKGARVYRNGDAKVRLADSKASITEKSMSDQLVANYFYATGRNLSYLLRLRRGTRVAWTTSLYMFATRGARAAFNVPLSHVLEPIAKKAAARARRLALQDRAFMRGLSHGLTRPGVERAAAKRGEIIEIAE